MDRMNDLYVLAYTGEAENRYYCGPGKSTEPACLRKTTDDLQRATLMDMDQALRLWDRAACKPDWRIWKVKHGISLDYSI